MKKYLKKCIAVVLSGAMTMGIMGAMPTFAYTEDSNESITVSATAVSGDTFVVNEQNLEVTSDTAESYNYTDTVTEGVSALDVLVAMHKVAFAEAFTVEDSKTMLDLNNKGYITTVFGEPTSDIGYMINHDYAMTLMTKMEDGGAFELYFYQDTTYWSDTYVHMNEFIAYAGEETTLNINELTGDSVNSFNGAKLASVAENGYDLVPIAGGEADEDGNVKVTFENVGTYYVTLMGEIDKEVTVNWSTWETGIVKSRIVPSVTKINVLNRLATKAYTETAETIAAMDLGYGSEWKAIGLSRAGEKVSSSYYKSVLDAIENEDIYYNGAPSVANNAKVIMALTAMGKSVSGDLLLPFASYESVSNLYITSLAYALVALDAGDYEIPENADSADQNTREKMIEILISGLKDNSIYTWGVDSAAMIVQALAPYYKDDRIKAIIDETLTKMDEVVETNVTEYSDLCSSYAQMILVYTELGLDAADLVNKMLAYYSEEDKAFLYCGAVNSFSTEQGFLALTAYHRYIYNRNTLLDMSDSKYKIVNMGNDKYSVYSPFNGKIAVMKSNYNEDKTLNNVEIENIDCKNNENVTFEAACDKLMIWDSADNMISLCEVQ